MMVEDEVKQSFQTSPNSGKFKFAPDQVATIQRKLLDESKGTSSMEPYRLLSSLGIKGVMGT